MKHQVLFSGLTALHIDAETMLMEMLDVEELDWPNTDAQVI